MLEFPAFLLLFDNLTIDSSGENGCGPNPPCGPWEACAIMVGGVTLAVPSCVEINSKFSIKVLLKFTSSLPLSNNSFVNQLLFHKVYLNNRKYITKNLQSISNRIKKRASK